MDWKRGEYRVCSWTGLGADLLCNLQFCFVGGWCGSVVVVLLCAICNFAVFHVWCCCYRSARGGCCVKSCAYGNASCLVLLLLWLDADTRFGAFSFAVLCVHGCLGPWMAVADCPRSTMCWPALD
ncbi:hypothetical protein U1Q18_046574 [Sarracenia purpurea var. burkii]